MKYTLFHCSSLAHMGFCCHRTGHLLITGLMLTVASASAWAGFASMFGLGSGHDGVRTSHPEEGVYWVPFRKWQQGESMNCTVMGESK